MVLYTRNEVLLLKKYKLKADYHLEYEYETDLEGEDLFRHYAFLLNKDEWKSKAWLVRSENFCECDCGFENSTKSNYCGGCGLKLEIE